MNITPYRPHPGSDREAVIQLLPPIGILPGLTIGEVLEAMGHYGRTRPRSKIRHILWSLMERRVIVKIDGRYFSGGPAMEKGGDGGE